MPKTNWTKYAAGRYDLYRQGKLVAYVQRNAWQPRSAQGNHWYVHARRGGYGFFVQPDHGFRTMALAKSAAMAILRRG